MAINQVRPDTPLADTPEANFSFQKQEDPKPNKPYNQWTHEEKLTYKAWLLKNKGKEAVVTFLDSAKTAVRNEIEDKRTAKELAFKKLLAGNIKDKPFQLWTSVEKAKHKADLLAEANGKQKYISFRDSISTDTKKRFVEKLFQNTKFQGFGTDTTAYKKWSAKEEKKSKRNAGKSNLEGLNCTKESEKKGSCSTKGKGTANSQ